MPLTGNEVDANFFNLIHKALGDRPRPRPERRANERQALESRLRIALPRGPGLPNDDEFFEVQGYDIDRRGFSFLLPFRPRFDRVVAAFGAAPAVIYLGAKVVRATEVLVYADGPPAGSPDRVGKPMVLVGCQFTERLQR